MLCVAVATVRAGFPYAEATVDQLQAGMAAGKFTAHELTAAYLQRIAAIDQSGPGLHAVIEVNPDALAIADQLDAERKAGKVRGPLHGIPVLIKDNIDTADHLATTAGSLALVGSKPRQDSGVAARLRAAGAIILGKTNLSEWANIRSTTSTSGWSGRGGQTHNPYALDRDPSGSSSGSGAGVAANLCALAVGTETDGSIVSPAATCGVVGLKPTVGLVSRAGIIPIAASQDTAGPMTRTVRDAALLLAALAGPDERDVATKQIPAGLSLDFAAALQPGALQGARIGVLHGPFGLHPRMEAVLAAAVARLKSAGAEIVELGDFPDLGKVSDPELEVLLYELKDGLNTYLAGLGPDAPVKTLADVIRFNEAHHAQEMPFFAQELFVRAEGKGPLTEAAYRDARALCLKLARTDGIDALVAKHKLDALVALTGGPAWLIDPVNGDTFTGGSSTPAAVAGYPSVTVPAAQVFGLPVGLSFIGPAWTDGRLLALAADFEAHTQARREPQFPSTVKLD